MTQATVLKATHYNLGTLWAMKGPESKNNPKVSSLSDRVNDGNIDSKIRSIIFLRDGKIAFFQFAV